MVRKLWLILLAPLAAFMIGCGGGANSDPPDTLVRLNLNLTGDGEDQTFVEVEMVKSLTNQIGVAEVQAVVSNPTGGVVNNTVRVVTLSSYSLSYRRLDGSNVVPEPFTGTLEERITAGENSSIFDVVIFPVREKLTTAFAQEFLGNINGGAGGPIDMELTMTVTGRNDAGETVTGTDTIRLQAAVYEPTDELLPQIQSFDQTTSLQVGQDYLASWFVDVGNFSFFGQLIFPWGNTVPLSQNLFPVGGMSFPTDNFVPGDASSGEPAIEPGTSVNLPSGVLVLGNPFGTVRSDSTDRVTITNPPPPDPDPEPEPDPVTIDQFFADRTTINEGEEVEITVLLSGGVTKLQLSPSVYGGESVVLPSSPVPKFFTFKIKPDFSVRPFLVAMDEENDLQDSAFLDTAITVIPAADNPPQILFFRASNTTVPVGGRVVLFWRIIGGTDKVELLPINNNIIDVTTRDSYTTPPFNQEGVQSLMLLVTPSNGSTPIFQTLTLNVSEVANEPVEIQAVNQQPGNQVGNDDQGAFSFTIFDPEGQDSSWRVSKIAGDNVSFFPLSGKIPDGLGDDTVAFDDKVDNANGFFTFELSAWDDDNFGFSLGSNRTVRLITYTTPDRLTDNAPVITNETFTPAAEDNSTGTISFTYRDPDTLNLRWSVRIAAGDFGGNFDRAGGTNNTGGGDEAITYTDDPDTPDADVVFLIQVVEQVNVNPQADVALIQVNKGTGEVVVDPEEEAITFPFTGLYDNNFGGVEPFDEIDNFTIFFNGDLGGTPQFYKNSDLSDAVNAASLVIDTLHNTNDPQSVTNVYFIRNFISPSTADNNGEFSFVNFFPNPGASDGGSVTPIDGGVARWNMLFNLESFRNPNTSMLNLPSASGSRNYTVSIEARDNQVGSASITQIITVTVP